MFEINEPSRRRPALSLRTAAWVGWVAAAAMSCGVRAGEPAVSAGDRTAMGMAEVLVPGAPDHGIFDPSVARDGGGGLYLSFSGVGSTPGGAGVGALAVGTFLARSVDLGERWQLLGVINPSVAVELGRGHSGQRGRWQNEVSALVFDPYARPEARWKLFWHQYLNVNGARRFEHGWIAYKQAAAPAQLAGTKAIKLFTARGYDAVDDDAGGWTRPVIAGPGRVRLGALAADLASCVAVTEPGVLAKPEGIYLSLVCVRASPFGLLGFRNRVILLKCTRPCGAARSWSFVGTVLTQADAGALGLGKFSASDLFSAGGRDFITVSPVGSVPVPDAYKGCMVFRLVDLSRARLARDAGGRPQIQARVDLGERVFNGSCSFLPEEARPGLLIGGVEFLKRRPVEARFHIYRSSVAP